MVNIINLKSTFDAPLQPSAWVMIAAREDLGVKAWGQITWGPDAPRWETGWLNSFAEAMQRARAWAAEHGIETIYVEAGAEAWVAEGDERRA